MEELAGDSEAFCKANSTRCEIGDMPSSPSAPRTNFQALFEAPARAGAAPSTEAHDGYQDFDDEEDRAGWGGQGVMRSPMIGRPQAS